jgi:hypothetical protein
MLTALAGSRKAPLREVERAKMLVGDAGGASLSALMRRIGVGRPMIYTCIDQALAAGVSAELKDTYTAPMHPSSPDEAKAWVVSLACAKPVAHALAAERWSIAARARFVGAQATPAGHPRLAQAGKRTVWRLSNAHAIKPHKIRYDLARRDPGLERKRQDGLLV